MIIKTEICLCDVCGNEINSNISPINQNIQIRDKNLCLRCAGIMLDEFIKDKVEISDEMINKTRQFYQNNKNVIYC